jgi:hypothetical protein
MMFMTFCACCGSQLVNDKGEYCVSALGLVNLREGPKALYVNKYGPDVETRFGAVSWRDMMNKADRRNKPGVTCAALPLEQALELLFDDENRHLGEGYEINDPDQGHVISIVWKNA